MVRHLKPGDWTERFPAGQIGMEDNASAQWIIDVLADLSNFARETGRDDVNRHLQTAIDQIEPLIALEGDKHED